MTLTLTDIVIADRARTLVALSAEIPPGTVLTVMGPSGAGKSTLLLYAAGLLTGPFRASGTVRINGTDITRLPAAERRMGLLFQAPLLYPHMSVGANVLFAVRRQGGDGALSRASRKAAAAAALAGVGLAGFERRDPSTLSGGEQSRVALARTLAARPRALLLDEPFSALDAALRDNVRAMVFAAARERALPVLLVTHDAADADAAGGPVVTIGGPNGSAE